VCISFDILSDVVIVMVMSELLVTATLLIYLPRSSLRMHYHRALRFGFVSLTLAVAGIPSQSHASQQEMSVRDESKSTTSCRHERRWRYRDALHLSRLPVRVRASLNCHPRTTKTSAYIFQQLPRVLTQHWRIQ
jgi:hypothetical protein